MLCELCGQSSKKLRVILIEGTELNVCPRCAKFGVEKSPKPKKTTAPVHVETALQRRVKKKIVRDVFENWSEDLVPDYNQRIKKARESKNWTQEDLAKKLNEKKSIILKIESGSMRPDDILTKKLERVLSINLRERID